MKSIFTLLAICFSLNLTTAQLAKDFTVTSTQGEVINLFELLDQGKTVVLDIFFVDCPPCNGIAPFMQQKYMEWGEGRGDVQFISLTDVDLNAKIREYEQLHGLSFPAAGRDSGGTLAVAPYISGQFGQFLGYPTIVVVAPDKSVNYDIWGSSYQNTIDLLEAAIVETGASKTTSVFDRDTGINLNVYPNPVVDFVNIELNLVESSNLVIKISNITGQKIKTIQTASLSEGKQGLSLDMSDQPKGIYLIQLVSKTKVLATFSILK